MTQYPASFQVLGQKLGYTTSGAVKWGHRFVPIPQPEGTYGRKKKIDLEALILGLLQEKAEINVSAVALAARLSKSDERDRKAIRRMLTALVDRGILQAEKAARARVYVLTKTSATKPLFPDEEATKPFKNIPLSKKSEALLKYISQPIQARTLVGYNQDFLRSYDPNRTSYLTEPQRAELLKIGTVETKLRPAGTYARNILNRLFIDLSWNSSRLEGNTYSLLETKRLIELGENAAGKNASETQMILNHKEAIEYIIESATEKK